MDLRRRFFEDTERRTMHAGSITDADWAPLVEKMPGPWCFVSEAVLLYVSGDDARDVVGRIASGFPGSTLLMDTGGLVPRAPGRRGIAVEEARRAHRLGM